MVVALGVGHIRCPHSLFSFRLLCPLSLFAFVAHIPRILEVRIVFGFAVGFAVGFIRDLNKCMAGLSMTGLSMTGLSIASTTLNMVASALGHHFQHGQGSSPPKGSLAPEGGHRDPREDNNLGLASLNSSWGRRAGWAGKWQQGGQRGWDDSCQQELGSSRCHARQRQRKDFAGCGTCIDGFHLNGAITRKTGATESFMASDRLFILEWRWRRLSPLPVLSFRNIIR